MATSLLKIVHPTYFHTFKNDYSGKIWVYLLTEKKEVFNTFKELKNLVEIQSGYKLKQLRIYRGSEFISNEFESYYKNNKI